MPRTITDDPQAATEATQLIIARARTAAEEFLDALPEVIASQDEYERLASALLRVNAADRNIEQWFAPMKRTAHAAWRAVCDQENASRDVLRAVIVKGRALLNAWTEAETARNAALQREQVAALAALPVEMQEFAIADLAPPRGVAPAVAGVETRMRTVITVDVRALCRAIADGVVPESLVQPHMASINRHRRDGHVVPGVTETQVPTTVFRG